MAQKNDERIMQLKETIAQKKKELAAGPKRFAPITNCILAFDNFQYNLHVLTEPNLEFLLVRLNAYVMSAINLDLDPAEVKISGYSLLDWCDDLKQLIEIRDFRQKKSQLEKLEKQLDALLSDDKKTELEIESIAELLK